MMRVAVGIRNITDRYCVLATVGIRPERDNDGRNTSADARFINTSKPEQNGCRFADGIFQNHLLKWNSVYLASTFTDICMHGANGK